jgi:hypothetical protein
MRQAYNSSRYFILASKHFLFLGIFMLAILSGCGRIEQKNVSHEKRASKENTPDTTVNKKIAVPADSSINQKTKTTSMSFKGELKVVYGSAQKAGYKKLEEAYQKTQFFEKLARLLNQTIALPRDVAVVPTQCGLVNAFYQHDKHRIVICHELTEDMFKLFKKQGLSNEEALKKTFQAVAFTFFHESGHMVIHELNLPTTGKEEDAADQFSTLLLAARGEAGEDAALAAAAWFGLGNKPSPSTRQYMNEHSLDQQRFYSIVCLLYGDEPEKFAELAKKSGLDNTRLKRCRGEYTQVSTSWNKLLRPYLKKSDL